MKKRGKLKGLIAAVHTAFNPDGSINCEAAAAQAKVLLKQGVAGAYVSGTTGEGVSCSAEERERLFDAWAKAAKGKLFLIAHAGGLALPDVQRLAAHAESAGFDAVSIVPPNYFRPSSIAGLIDFLKAALEGAQRIPFYYYHTGMSGVAFDMERFLEAADGRLGTLAGIKFNYPDLCMYQRCLAACGGKYDITWGIDEWYAGAIASGAESAIGSTYNYAAPIYRRIEKAVREGRLGAAAGGMRKVCAIVGILAQYGGVAAGKAMMAVHGLDLGDVRPPISPLTAAQKSDCCERLRRAGFR